MWLQHLTRQLELSEDAQRTQQQTISRLREDLRRCKEEQAIHAVEDDPKLCQVVAEMARAKSLLERDLETMRDRLNQVYSFYQVYTKHGCNDLST